MTTLRQRRGDDLFRRLNPAKVGLCFKELYEFTCAAWHVVEPGRRFVPGWHIHAMAVHLEAVLQGVIPQLLITIPPNTTKSRLVGVFWPAWAWLRWPALKFLYVGNSTDLAEELSTECRALVESNWYRFNFGVRWWLRHDQNAKAFFQNTAGGHRLSLGINSMVTGRKGDVIVCDDCNDANKTIQSAAERKRVRHTYEASIHDRIIDFAKPKRVCVGQRTHVEDLPDLVKSLGYFELMIPEEFDPPRRFHSPIGWTDPRTLAGELLRGDAFTEAEAKAARKRNYLLYQAKHQQAPRPKEGIIFKEKYLRKRWRWAENYEHITLTDERGTYKFHWRNDARAIFSVADPAASSKTSADFTVVGTFIVTQRFDVLWLGCRREQLEIPEQPRLLLDEYTRWGSQWAAVEAVFANVALFQYARRDAMTVIRVDPGSKDKLTRAIAAIVASEAGELWFPEENWAYDTQFPLDETLDELTAFTGDEKADKHDDLVDVLAYAVKVRNDRFGIAGLQGSPNAIPGPQFATAWAQGYGTGQ